MIDMDCKLDLCGSDFLGAQGPLGFLAFDACWVHNSVCGEDNCSDILAKIV